MPEKTLQLGAYYVRIRSEHPKCSRQTEPEGFFFLLVRPTELRLYDRVIAYPEWFKLIIEQEWANLETTKGPVVSSPVMRYNYSF
jgi:hypothetical protein